MNVVQFLRLAKPIVLNWKLREIPSGVGALKSGPEGIRALVYFGDSTTGSEHIYRQWADVFDKSGVPYVALFRHPGILSLARAYRPNSPMALARNGNDIANIIASCPNLKVAFYTGNPGNIAQMMQYNHFRHVFIGHGDSDKATSASRMFRLYDEVWVAGTAHEDRLQGLLPSDVAIRIVGRPQVASALTLEDTVARSVRPTFAFLPTWEGAREEINYTSAHLTEGLAKCIEGIGGIMRAKYHPSTGHRLRKLKSLEKDLRKSQQFGKGRSEIVGREEAATALMDGSDFCVTDVSSIVSDWIVRDRPLFVYIPSDVATSTSKFPIESYSYTFRSVEEFASEISRVVVDEDDYKRDQRRKAADYLISREATTSDAFGNRARLLCE